jgi:hypothetical protein
VNDGGYQCYLIGSQPPEVAQALEWTCGRHEYKVRHVKIGPVRRHSTYLQGLIEESVRGRASHVTLAAARVCHSLARVRAPDQ